jgi:hypothetical protein
METEVCWTDTQEPEGLRGAGLGGAISDTSILMNLQEGCSLCESVNKKGFGA